MRMEKRLASVAVSVNCQYGKPKRRFRSSPTKAPSSVGSISVIPCFTRFATASATISGECPVIAPVSPRHKSTYSFPSAQVKCAPFAFVTKTGNSPAHFFIQFIGTPPSSDCCARLYNSAERGCSATKRLASRSCNFFNFSRLMFVMLVGTCHSEPIRRGWAKNLIANIEHELYVEILRGANGAPLRMTSGRGSPQFVDDFLCRVCSRSACQSIPRMRSVAAEKKPFHRSLIARPIEKRPHGEELVQRKFAVENVAARETVSRFQI